ncbi:alpha-1,4-glucan branching enzyme [Friedmanniomyces endolithicus]|nr:alpha-1,4-glucan branching enzyme [Friedmanniomyces endolithicus]
MDPLNEAAQDSITAAPPSQGIPADGTGIVSLDPYLEPCKPALKSRFSKAQQWIKTIDETEGGLEQFSRGYERFGFNVADDHTITYREWAPSALRAYLIGDFNGWNRESHEMKRDTYGVWEIVVPPASGRPAIAHDSKLKISMVVPNDQARAERIPAWIKRVTQDLSVSPIYDARFWNSPHKYTFRHPRPPKPASARIYEAHVGISSPEPKVASYKEFTHNTLPRIHKLGYNTIQLMAVMEHAYYASFGYQINSFFAASSRYGSPDDLKELVDTAHGMGITVLLDVVHSHASKNVADGPHDYSHSAHTHFCDDMRRQWWTKFSLPPIFHISGHPKSSLAPSLCTI